MSKLPRVQKEEDFVNYGLTTIISWSLSLGISMRSSGDRRKYPKRKSETEFFSAGITFLKVHHQLFLTLWIKTKYI